jgi:hypothetical protein
METSKIGKLEEFISFLLSVWILERGNMEGMPQMTVF